MKIFDRHPHERALSLFAGNDLGPLQRRLIRRHLARCETCADTVVSYKGLRAELAGAAPVPDVDFLALSRQIRAAVAAEIAPETPWRWHRKATAGAALAASVLVAALFLFQQGDEPGPASLAVAEPSERVWKGPFDAESVEFQITSEGGLSAQAFYPASGTLTITDYYAP